MPTTTTGVGGPDGPGTSGGRFSGIRLSKGQAFSAAASSIAVVDGAPLDQAAIDSVLARLPEWQRDQSIEEAFRWPAETIAKPQPGRTVDTPFPAVDQRAPDDVPVGALHVLRTQPNGDVDVAPFVSITFDQPMVPVGTLGQLAATDVPASISPAIPGHWQWIGTRTLRFDADSDVIDRLPMATEFTVEVPAGTTSASGGVLADAVTFSFATPPVSVQSFEPTGDSQPLVPVFVATFDQRVDQQAVLDTITVEADGDEHAMRLATADEIAADTRAQQIVDLVPEGRWIAFRPVDPFAPDSSISIDIGPGTPSAEGPLTSSEAQHYTAHTYEPLRITKVECAYGRDCPAGTEIDVQLNNVLDATRFDPSSVGIEPSMAGATVGVYGSVIVVQGATQADTEYSITLPANLTDTFGQQLGEPETVTVEVGEPRPFLQQFARPFTTVDPSADPPSIGVVSFGHDELRVRVFAVEPDDLPGFGQALSDLMYERRTSAPPPWTEVSDETIEVDDGGSVTETSIDLSGVLANGLGHVVVMVEPTEDYDESSDLYWMNMPAITWVQATDLGVDAFADNDEVRAWVTDLATGAPRADVTVQLYGGSTTASTDGDGVAALPLTPSGAIALIATAGDDVAILPNGYFGGGWSGWSSPDHALWYVFDDRQTYRPGETVSVKGWVRQLTAGPDAQVRLFGDEEAVGYVVRDAQGNVIAESEASLNPLGGFDFTVAIPAGANLGTATIELMLRRAGFEQQQFLHSFQIQEFRRPDFEVTARTESPGPYVVGDPATVAVDASYYAGGALAAAPVGWQVSATASTYSPPGWDDYQFGRWVPWWYASSPTYLDSYAGAADYCCDIPSTATKVQQYSGTTDGAGHDYLQIDVGDLGDELDGRPLAVTAEATVTDVNRQALSGRTTILVHPADLYVGLRSDRTFVREGDALDVSVVVAGIDGEAVAGRPVSVTAGRNTSVFANGTWTDTLADTQTCDVTSAAEAVSCRFTTGTGGTYTITATVIDDVGRANVTELTRWVSGATSVPSRIVEQQALTIVPNGDEYAPGDTAELLVQAPFSTGTGLMVISRAGIRSTHRFELADGSAVVQVPIADRDIPNLDVAIEVVGSTPRVGDDGEPIEGAPASPAFAAGSLTLPVSTASRALHVVATPASTALRPGEATQVDVSVTDAAGQPVLGGDLAVVVVDEAVLALSGYRLTDPLATFYAHLPNEVSTQFGRGSVVLIDPTKFFSGGEGGGDGADDAASATTAAASEETAAPGDGAPSPAAGAADRADGDSAGSSTTPIDVRTDFEALAVFAPSVTTDASGHATIDVPLPDNLTRYRVMVVAAAGENQFGSGDANITARLPLMVRPAAPRFLNFGDSFELPVVVQNQTDAAMDVDVVLQTSNLTPAEAVGQRVNVPANDRVEVRFPVAASQAGTARFRVAAVSGEAADAATVELPVYTPATAETFATYGVVDEGAVAQPVLAPTDVIPQFGGLDITTSSTSLQALTDAVIYLTDYPYESSDALASRILSIAALRDVLDAFDAPGLPSPSELNAAVRRDIDALVAMQNGDGGWPYWSQSRPSEPYNSVQVTHALLAAKDAGYSVPQSTLDFGLSFVRDIEQHIPSEYSQDARDTISAYALHVRMVAGDRDSAKAERLYGDRDGDLPLDAIAWLWPVIDDSGISAEIERLVGNRAVDTAGAVTFTTGVFDDQYVTLSSDRRTDGLVLDALIRLRPQSDLIVKVVNGLMAGQQHGRWDNVQENAFILLALKHYFDAFEGAEPQFVARVWLGEQYAGEQAYSGRSTDRHRITIPTAQLQEIGDSELVLAKDGTGRLYYRIGLRTAPADLTLDALDRGFVVSRTYEAVDDPSDVTRDADGTWHIKAGARVRVRLTLVAESQRTHVGLIDPLPAGLEILNPALEVTGDVPDDPEQPPVIYDSWWWPTWFDHQNLRDDRAEAFSTYLPAGTYDYSYVARATTPGTFVTPPTRAEEIYTPETFGRASTDTVVVDG
ncbi:MAG: alpha-2-macroglobulin family protein [Ilumatobacteraceae bacterium]